RELEARLGRSFVPVFADDCAPAGAQTISYEPSSSMASLANLSDRDLFDLCARTSQRPVEDGRPICVYVSDDAGALCAAAFAAYSDRPLVELDSASIVEERPSSVTVVVSSELLATKGTEWLQQRVRALAGGSTPFGILTARGEPALSRFVARSLRRVPAQRGVAEMVWIPEAKPFGFDESGGTRFADMRAMDARGPSAQVLYFRGHGREYCAQSGRLCSRPAWSDEMRACVHGLECIADEWARKPARDVRSDVVFLENCKGGRFLGGLDPFQNLTTMLVEGGASTVFASSGRYYADELTPLLSLRLMADGWTFGRIARALNRFHEQRFGTLDYVLLFGDPEGTPFADREPMPELEATGDGLELRFRVGAPIASDAEFFLIRRGATSLDDGPYTCSEHPPEPSGMRALLLRLDDTYAVMIVLGGRGATGELVFHRRPPIDADVFAAASHLVERLAVLATAEDALVQRRASALGRVLQDAGAAVAMAIRRGSASMHENLGLSSLERNVADAASDLALQHARSVAREVANVGWLETIYAEAGRLDHLPETYGSSHCPTCELPLLSCHYQVFGLRPDHRERFECERCGAVCDVLSGSSHVWIEAPSQVALGERFEARVRGKNGTDTRLYLGAAATIGYIPTSKYELTAVNCPAVVPAGGEFTITFDCRLDESVRANIYDLRAILSMNGALALANRSIMYKRPA
ncbi:MAG TPA: hypothetical protein VM925_25955, partial [Labilithrix sp.]|nr:hypothetical protein [Labilithrix sp.]